MISRRRVQAGFGASFGALGAVAWIAEDAREPTRPLSADTRVLHYVVDHRTDGLVSVARVVTHLGDPLVLAALAVIATVLLWRTRVLRTEAVAPLIALLLASTVESIAKIVIGRPRPPVGYHLIHESDAAFPSGHSTGSAALFFALGLVVVRLVGPRAARWALLAAAAGVPALVGASRVILGVHWFTDVVAGWLLGVGFALGVVVFVRWLADEASPREPRRRGQPRRTHLEARLPDDDGPLSSVRL